MFLSNQQVTEEIKRKIKKKNSSNKWQWKHDNSKSVWCSKSSSKREVYNNTILPQETTETSNRQTNFTPKATGKRRRKNSKISRRKEIIIVLSRNNETEIKETKVKISKTKSWFFEKINKIDKP